MVDRRADDVVLPPGVLAMADRGKGWAAWVDALPRLVAGLVAEWGLVVDGPPRHGRTALVLPVRDEDGVPLALKVGHVHPESEHEHLALQRWGGSGAVRMLRADPRRGALLLERLEPTDLTGLWDVEACEVVGGLYGVLHVPAPPRLRRLSRALDATAHRLRRLGRGTPLPPRLVEQAAALARDLADDPGTDGVLVHTDLHYENLLAVPAGAAGERGEWVAIDPKPLSGDPHHEVAPLLWNRWPEVVDGWGGVRAAVRRRFHAVVDAAGLDEHRARDHVVVRVVDLAVDALGPGGRGTLGSGLPDRGDLGTLCVSVAKAVQD